jgi:hypothetical protein
VNRILGAAGVLAVVPLLMASSSSRETAIPTADTSSVPAASSVQRYGDAAVLIGFTEISGVNDDNARFWPDSCDFTLGNGVRLFAKPPANPAVADGDSTGES